MKYLKDIKLWMAFLVAVMGFLLVIASTGEDLSFIASFLLGLFGVCIILLSVSFAFWVAHDDTFDKPDE